MGASAAADEEMEVEEIDQILSTSSKTSHSSTKSLHVPKSLQLHPQVEEILQKQSEQSTIAPSTSSQTVLQSLPQISESILSEFSFSPISTPTARLLTQVTPSARIQPSTFASP